MTTTSKEMEQQTSVKRRSPMVETWENLRRSWAGMIGLFLIIIHVLVATTSPFWIPNDPLLMSSELRSQNPTSEFFMGNDKLGRDVFDE